MRIRRHFRLVLAAITTLCLIACQQAQPPTKPTATAELKAATTERVLVVFEGPWAIVPDPKDPNSILAIAPKTKSHRPLAVVPANATLEAGIYDLAVPAHGAPAPYSFDSSFYRANVDPKTVQHILDDHLERYAIRLPKPEGYLAGTRHRSRVGKTYPPDASTEQNYATSISLRYNVTSLEAFSLTGTKNAGGTLNRLSLPLETPIVRFAIDPAQDLTGDNCNNHSRQAFSDLVRLLSLTLYVDFPENPSDCHKKDPQVAVSEKARTQNAFAEEATAGFPSPQAASFAGTAMAGSFQVVAAAVENRLAAAIYLLHTGMGACTSPIIVGGS